MKKKFLALLLAAVMVLSLAACGGDSGSGDTGDTGSAADVGQDAGGSTASDYPTKGITVICPWAAGGGTDSCLRAFSDAVGKQLGQTLSLIHI